MTIEAKVLVDSISPDGVRLVTMQLKYNRFIHAELMTHRVFSRNTSSSRAIPVKTIIQRIKEEPAMPVYWGLNQKGMQAREEASGELLEDIHDTWLGARDMMIEVAEYMMSEYNLHKQLVNRLLEPWSHIYAVVTATEWENFFHLRRHPDAQPEIKVLADAMWEAYMASSPVLVDYAQWHLPYVLPEDVERAGSEVGLLQKISSARCARVSYKTHDGFVPKFEEDIRLHDDLLSGGHMSPLEHPATPLAGPKKFSSKYIFCGNFRGWKQYRKMIPGEAVFRPSQ